MSEDTKEKYLKIALVVVGVMFLLVYPLSLIWPSGGGSKPGSDHATTLASPRAPHRTSSSRSKSLSRSEVKWRELQLFSTSAHFA